MPLYDYTARTGEGKIERGTLVAQDVQSLEKKLLIQGLTLTSSTLGKKKSSVSNLFSIFNTVPSVEKIFFTQYLHVMIKAGFSIARALDTLAKQSTNKYFRSVLAEVKSDVESGISFSRSIAKHPRVFNEYFVNMVAAGESSGKLDEVLSRLGEKLKKDHGLISKVKGALTYPVIIIIAMVSVAILVTIVVIPKLTEIFSETGTKLPLPTRILIGASDFLIHHGIIAAAALIVVVVLFIRLLKTKSGKQAFDATLLRLPIFSPIIKKVNLARFTRSLSSMLETNIPIIETFMIISRTMGNSFYKHALESTATRLKTGSTISKNLELFPTLFPPLTTQMIAIGEESGSLDTISGELAAFYEEEVDQTMTNLSTIIEPVLMLLLGAGVAVMAVAIILPIYSLSSQIG